MCFNSDVGDTRGSGLPPAHVNKHGRLGRERESDSRDTETWSAGVQCQCVPIMAPRIPHVLSPCAPAPMVSRRMVKVVPEPRAMPA